MAEQRISRVVAGEDKSGVTSSSGWKGGGGFRVWSVRVNKRQGPLPLPMETI
jgi:hypothetical protein